MQVRNIIRTSNLLRFSCPLRHQITAPFHHDHRTQKLDDPDSRVLSISLNSRELTLSLFLNKNRARERRKTKKGNRERKGRGERNEEEECFSHHMASLPLGHHHHHQPAAATIHPSQPPQCQPQPEVPRRSSDVETDKVLPLIVLFTNPRSGFRLSGAPISVDSPRSSGVAGVSTDLPVFRARQRFSPATPLIGMVIVFFESDVDSR